MRKLKDTRYIEMNYFDSETDISKTCRPTMMSPSRLSSFYFAICQKWTRESLQGQMAGPAPDLISDYFWKLMRWLNEQYHWLQKILFFASCFAD